MDDTVKSACENTLQLEQHNLGFECGDTMNETLGIAEDEAVITVSLGLGVLRNGTNLTQGKCPPLRYPVVALSPGLHTEPFLARLPFPRRAQR